VEVVEIVDVEIDEVVDDEIEEVVDDDELVGLLTHWLFTQLPQAGSQSEFKVHVRSQAARQLFWMQKVQFEVVEQSASTVHELLQP